MIDHKGFRAGIGIIIVNKNREVFWAKRIGNTGWQFPQGGMQEGETTREAMYRELHEEVGLLAEHVTILAEARSWFYYYLPRHLVRRHAKPLCIGQKQKWFLLELIADEKNVSFDQGDVPEFDGYRWVSYWYPLKEVVFFKRRLYQRVLREFQKVVFKSAC